MYITGNPAPWRAEQFPSNTKPAPVGRRFCAVEGCNKTVLNHSPHLTCGKCRREGRRRTPASQSCVACGKAFIPHVCGSAQRYCGEECRKRCRND
jgi:hypothetical protein